MSRIIFSVLKASEPEPVSWIEIKPSATWNYHDMSIQHLGEYDLTAAKKDSNLIADGTIVLKAPK